MRSAVVWLGLLLLTGCAAVDTGAVVPAPEEECERSGGTWRAALAFCERQGFD